MNVKHINDSLMRGWLDSLRASGRSQGTINVRVSHVRRLLRHGDVSATDITEGHITEWMSQQQWGSAARASARASVRGFFTWMVKSGHADTNPAAAIEPVRQPRAVPQPMPDAYVVDAMRCDDRRVSMAVEIMATCGLRRDETARVKSSDVTPIGKGWALRVVGKGGHTRIVPCPSRLARRIAKAGGYVFPGGVDGHISAGWLGKLISRHLPKDWTPHKIRHRYASAAYGASRDLRAVQSLLGHASPATTQVYVAVHDQDLIEAASGTWSIAA